MNVLLRGEYRCCSVQEVHLDKMEVVFIYYLFLYFFLESFADSSQMWFKLFFTPEIESGCLDGGDRTVSEATTTLNIQGYQQTLVHFKLDTVEEILSEILRTGNTAVQKYSSKTCLKSQVVLGNPT